MNLWKKITQKTVQTHPGRTNASHASAPSTTASVEPGEPQVVSGIDEALRLFTGRNLVTSAEIIDHLLDLRYHSRPTRSATPSDRISSVPQPRSQHDIAVCRL